jgi:hypothetical protein
MPNDDTPTKSVDEKKQDVQEKYVDDTQNETIRKFLGGQTDQPEPKKEVKKDVSEDKAEVKADDKKPEIDLEKETTKIKQDIVKKLSESFGLTEEEQVQAEEEGVEAPWVKEKRTPKSYEEVAEFASDLAEFKRQKAIKEQEKKKQIELDNQRKQNESINQLWDLQLGEMRESGLIPKIDEKVAEKMKKGEALSQEDLEDPGIKVQRELFDTMAQLAQERRAQKKPVVTNLKEVYYEHYRNKEAKQPAGADAPVSGARPSVTPKEGDFTYADINNKSYYDILNEG